MTTEEQQIQEQISSIWQKTDDFLANHNNSLLLFDFTTVSHYENGGIKIKSIYQHKIKNYPKQLEEYFDEHGYSIPPTASNDEPTPYSVKNYQEPLTIPEPIYEIYDPKTVTHTEIVGLDTWHKFVEEKKIAGQCLTLFKDFINDEETKERIEVGVYVLLKNQFLSDENANKQITDFISFEIYKFLYGRGREYFTKEYKETSRNLQKIKILRNQQRTINHYLRPIFTGISLKAKDVQTQIDGSKTDDAKLAAKVLQLQAEILEHHFKLGQRLDDIAEQTEVEKFNIGFEYFFEYLYIRNFFTGSHIDLRAIKSLNDNEYNLVKEICTTSLQDFFESQSNFDTTVNTLFSKLSGASSFKLHFRGQTSKMFFELPKSLASMNVVIKFSSAFIENFKKFWMKDAYVSSTGSALNSFLIVYANTNEIYFFQYKENQGYKDFAIDLPENSNNEQEAKFIENYTKDFTEHSSASGLGNNDLKSLLENNNIGCSTQKKDVKIQYTEDGEQKSKDGYLYFKKLTLNDNSTLIKK